MNKLRLGLFSIILSCCIALPAGAGDFLLGTGLGRSVINLDQSVEVDDITYDSDESPSLGVTAGYIFDSNFIVAASYTGLGASLSDIFGTDKFLSYTGEGVLLGYSFNLGKKARLVPMIGIDEWELGVYDFHFFGEDELKQRKSGTNAYGRINLEIPLGDFFSLELSAIYGNMDLFTLNTQRVGVNFRF